MVFCGEAAVHRLSWNALRLLSITTYEELGGVDDTLFSLLMSRPQVGCDFVMWLSALCAVGASSLHSKLIAQSLS